MELCQLACVKGHFNQNTKKSATPLTTPLLIFWHADSLAFISPAFKLSNIKDSKPVQVNAEENIYICVALKSFNNISFPKQHLCYPHPTSYHFFKWMYFPLSPYERHVAGKFLMKLFFHCYEQLKWNSFYWAGRGCFRDGYLRIWANKSIRIAGYLFTNSGESTR